MTEQKKDIARHPHHTSITQHQGKEALPQQVTKASHSAVPMYQTFHLGSSSKSTVELLADKDFEPFERTNYSLVKALTYMATHYSEGLTIQKLANVSYISASYLTHLFKAELKISFKELLSQLRVEHAKRLIISNPAQTITTISTQVGFDECSYFERQFRRHHGMTPREFQNKCR